MNETLHNSALAIRSASLNDYEAIESLFQQIHIHHLRILPDTFRAIDEVQHDFGACVILQCGLSLWQPSDELTIVAKLGYCCHPSGNKNLELCFETETFPSNVGRIKASGATLLHDVVEEPWGQQAVRFFDPDGNLVELGESIPTFVRRHHAVGLSPEAVAEKTGVPLEAVLQHITQAIDSGQVKDRYVHDTRKSHHR